MTASAPDLGARAAGDLGAIPGSGGASSQSTTATAAVATWVTPTAGSAGGTPQSTDASPAVASWVTPTAASTPGPVSTTATPAVATWVTPTATAYDPSFPIQYDGLRIWDGATPIDLCLVATTDAPAGMGAEIRFRGVGVTYSAYLVETTDPFASAVRVRTTTGTKAIRLKT